MYRRITLAAIVLILGLLVTVSPVFAAVPSYTYLNTVQLVIGNRDAAINGNPATMDQAAYTKSGRTLVPFRFLAEALGAEVGWEPKTGTASLILRGTEVKVTLGSKIAYINGVVSTLDVAAELRGGRTFIPLRFVSEALGARVDYQAETQKVLINLVDTTGWNSLDDPNQGKIFYPPDWKINGDSNSNLEVISPAGTRITIKLVQEEASKIISEKKQVYAKEGFQDIQEGPTESRGTMLLLLKLDLKKIDNSDAIIIITEEKDKGNLVIEVSAKFDAMPKDLVILDKMFPR